MGTVLRRPVVSAVSNRHLLSHSDDEARRRLVEWAAALANADVDVLQIRERGLDDIVLAQLVRDVVAATAGSPMRVLVNDRTDIALATGAAGVHLPSNAPSAAVVRGIVPDRFLIGRSVHASDDLAIIERNGGCDYLTFGTVYPSASKPQAHPPAGVDSLARACAATRLPVLAIGGVSVGRAVAVAGTGAAGVAAIRLFVDPWLEGSHPAERVERLAATVASLRGAFTGAGRAL